MAWVKLDDHFDEHPKFQGLSSAAITLWIFGLTYCGRNLTDGRIPKARASDDSVRLLRGSSGDPSSELVSSGLWHDREDHFYIHDYPSYQPLKAEVLAKREKDRARKFHVESERNPKLSSVPRTRIPYPDPKKKKKDTGTASRSLFVPPSLEEVKAYCLERKNRVSPDGWFDHYESNGWRVGKNPMRSWKAAVRTWERDPFGSNEDNGNGEKSIAEQYEEGLKRLREARANGKA